MKNPSVIIIKKKGKGHHGGHYGGAWKVAYADFVTAMMAFFLVMWLVAQSQGVKQAVAGYFRDPGIFEYEKSNSPIAGGRFALDQTIQSPARSERPAQAVAKDLDTLAKTAGRLKDLLGQMPEVKRLGKQIEIQLTPEGLRIELLEATEATFFDTGSAVLKPHTERILATIASELGKLQNDIVLEGHTDSVPYARRDGYSNWELSADRANAARRVMERSGLHAHQVKGVRGFADTRLRPGTEPIDPRNRRVSIVVQNAGPTAASIATPVAPTIAPDAHDLPPGQPLHPAAEETHHGAAAASAAAHTPAGPASAR